MLLHFASPSPDPVTPVHLDDTLKIQGAYDQPTRFSSLGLPRTVVLYSLHRTSAPGLRVQHSGHHVQTRGRLEHLHCSHTGEEPKFQKEQVRCPKPTADERWTETRTRAAGVHAGSSEWPLRGWWRRLLRPVPVRGGVNRKADPPGRALPSGAG